MKGSFVKSGQSTTSTSTSAKFLINPSFKTIKKNMCIYITLQNLFINRDYISVMNYHLLFHQEKEHVGLFLLW